MRNIGRVLSNLSASVKCLRNVNLYTCRFMSSVKGLDLSGIYPPIPTPFEDNEDIAWDKLTFNLARWEKVPFKGRSALIFSIKMELIKMIYFILAYPHPLSF